MVGHEIWREQLKNVQNEKHYKTEKHKHCLTWNMAIHTQNMENEKCTLLELQYCEKSENHGIRNSHGRT